MINYSVSTQTSDVMGAATDSIVFVTLYGEHGDSGERKLRKSDNMNKFERGQVKSLRVLLRNGNYTSLINIRLT